MHEGRVGTAGQAERSTFRRLPASAAYILRCMVLPTGGGGEREQATVSSECRRRSGLAGVRQKAYGYAVSPRIRKFVTPLRRFGPDIPVLTADKTTYPGIDYYNVEVGVFRDHLHDDLPNGTRLCGYAASGGEYKHLGGAILAEKTRLYGLSSPASCHQRISCRSTRLSLKARWGRNTGPDRAAIHLHGGLVPWPSDGGPFHWVSNADNGGLKVGASLVGAEWLPDASGAKTNDYFYPNHQSARFMWYHDHAIGITRTNAYAGIATGYFITDSAEKSLGIPSPGDILVFQDKGLLGPRHRSVICKPRE